MSQINLPTLWGTMSESSLLETQTPALWNFQMRKSTEFQLQEKKYWTVKMIDFKKVYTDPETGQEEWVENDNPFPKGGVQAILDTGTYLIYGPDSQVDNVVNEITIDNCLDSSDLPDLVFVFEGQNLENSTNGPKKVELRLPPKDYLLDFSPKNSHNRKKDCVIGVAPEKSEQEWTIG